MKQQFSIFTKKNFKIIESGIYEILEKLGFLCFSDNANKILKFHGSRVSEFLVKIPESIASPFLAQSKIMPVQKQRTILGYAENLQDISKHSFQLATPEDSKKIINLAHSMKQIDVICAAVKSSEIPLLEQAMHDYIRCFENSSKPFCCTTQYPNSLQEVFSTAQNHGHDISEKIVGVLDTPTILRLEENQIKILDTYIENNCTIFLKVPCLFNSPLDFPHAMALTLAHYLSIYIYLQWNNFQMPLILQLAEFPETPTKQGYSESVLSFFQYENALYEICQHFHIPLALPVLPIHDIDFLDGYIAGLQHMFLLHSNVVAITGIGKVSPFDFSIQNLFLENEFFEYLRQIPQIGTFPEQKMDWDNFLEEFYPHEIPGSTWQSNVFRYDVLNLWRNERTTLQERLAKKIATL